MSRQLATWLTAIFMAMTMALASTTTDAAEIKVIASAAVKDILVSLVPAFEQTSAHKVTLIFSGTEAIARKIGDGEVVDIVFVAAPTIDKLIAEGRLLSGSRVDVVKSGIGVAVRAGLPKPDISSGEAVKNAVLAAKSVAYSSGPSGFYLADLFKKMGIADQIKGKVTQTPSGVQVSDVLARGEADLGFQQVSELLHAKGIQYLGPLPADIQHTTFFSTGLHKAAPEADAARALVKFLTSPASTTVISAAGMEPG